MRPFGGARSARSHGVRGHACCLHGDVADYRRRPGDFFAEGVQDGLRVAYVSSDAAATEQALAGGFCGLAVSGDATELVVGVVRLRARARERHRA